MWLERLCYKRQPNPFSPLSPELLALREASCLWTCRWSIERPTQWGRGPPANSLCVLHYGNGPFSSCLAFRCPQPYFVIQVQIHETLWASTIQLSHSWTLDPQKLSDNKCLYFKPLNFIIICYLSITKKPIKTCLIRGNILWFPVKHF